MRTLIIILILTSNLARGQSTEQKALTFLIQNIYGQELKNSNGYFSVTKDSSQIWYYPFVQETKSKLHVDKGIKSGEEKFYKIVHSDKDIFIITKQAELIDKIQNVHFVIITKYSVQTLYTVTFKNNLPDKLLAVIPDNLLETQD